MHDPAGHVCDCVFRSHFVRVSISGFLPLPYAALRYDKAKLPEETTPTSVKLSFADKCSVLHPGYTYLAHHPSVEDCRKEMDANHPEGWFIIPTGIDPPNLNLDRLNRMFAERRLKGCSLGWEWRGQL